MFFLLGLIPAVAQDNAEPQESKLKSSLSKVRTSVKEGVKDAVKGLGDGPLITIDTSQIATDKSGLLNRPKIGLFDDNDSADVSMGDTSVVHYPVRQLDNDPYNKAGYSAMDLKDPKNYSKDVEYDSESEMYIFRSKINDTELDVPEVMSYDEYKSYDITNSLNRYFSNLGKNESGDDKKGLIDFALGASANGKIFGPGAITLKPQGYAELSFGVKTNTIDNPTLPERLRKTTVFDFDEKIQMNVVGSVGDKISMGMNYNTEASFDFDNKIKLDYKGKEDDIFQKVEAGNVSLPLGGTLINGSQSLFGFKTEMKFGRLTATSVFSQQESETEVMTLQGGASTSEFEIKVNEYDANRHFFLSHYFKDSYEAGLEQLPLIRTGVTITKIEIWVTNKQGKYDEARNIVAFADIAESDKNIHNSVWKSNTVQQGNGANTLYSNLSPLASVRDISQVTTELNNRQLDGVIDYEKIENARRLEPSEYTLNSKLGYISLRSALNRDEVLAVAYQYTFNGLVYNVGEFSTDGISSPNALIVKMLKGTNLSPSMPTWELMMKNIYSLGAYQVNQEDFELNIVYKDDASGSELRYIPKENLKDKRLIEVMKLDRLNRSLEVGVDGKFDFVEGYTIISESGKIIFPVLKPFGKDNLAKAYRTDVSSIEEYAFDEIYDTTKVVASQTAEKNKFLLVGSYKSQSGAEIKLNAMNIPRGSVKVTAGGTVLTENIDYSVDYSSGYVKILNSNLLESGAPIKISMENQALFSMQKKTMIGTHLDYKVNDDFNVGGTLMHLYEKPLTQKVSMGDDPIANTVWGMNLSYRTESRWLTRMVDKLPFIETKAPSSIAIDAEIAQLIPGHAKAVGKTGASYIDDFESTKIGIDLSNYFAWKLASTPTVLQKEADLIDDINYGKNRAKMAWYIVDRIFQEEGSLTPSNIDKDERSNHYSRAVNERNLFPNRDQAYGVSSLLSIFNVAFYPQEKGPYNYDLDITNEGLLNNPADRWGGIMRKIESSDFEQANIEYIEFWVMDPYAYHTSQEKVADDDAKLYFNLGNVSEDILKDGRKFFEHGLSSDGTTADLISTNWGYTPSLQSLVTAFDNNANSRIFQDVGLDGMRDTLEVLKRREYVTALRNLPVATTTEGQARIKDLIEDPSQDNYRYFRSSDWDREKASVLTRYKRYNNTDQNSPTTAMSKESYPTASSTLPDVEDINQDNTLSEQEGYFEYAIPFGPSKLNLANNFIVQKKVENVTLANGERDSVNWYLFKVPVKEGVARGTISDYSSIRFMRMVMKGFNRELVLRFATLELVRGEWRVYTKELTDNITNGDIAIEAVNIEENNDKQPVNYILPPDVSRVIDPSQPQLTQLNEESMVLQVKNLSKGGAKAVYKGVNMDIRMYKKLQMYVHAEKMLDGTSLKDDDLYLFLRLGSDYKNNYYEYEIPLKLTPEGAYIDNATNRKIVWPEDNYLNISLSELTDLKLKRNSELGNGGVGISSTERYASNVEGTGHNKYVIGNPDLGDIKTIMIGVRNHKSEQNVSGEVWVNELRLSEYDEDGGWAGRSSVAVNLADLGSVTMAGGFSTVGWGGLEDKVADRQMDNNYNYDLSTNIQLGKFFPAKANVSLPMNYSYSQNISSPKYSPYDSDIELNDVLANANSQSERDSLKRISQTNETRKSINFTNIKVDQSSKTPMPYDPANVSLSYGYNETNRTSPTVEKDLIKNYKGAINYNYNLSVKPVKPFNKIPFLDGKYFQLVKDFNFYLLPKSVELATDMRRNYSETKERSLTDDGYQLPVSVAKDFYWNRQMSLTYDLTQSINLRFSTFRNAILVEPDTLIDGRTLLLDRDNLGDDYKYWQTEIMKSARNYGRVAMYQQIFNANYNLPLNKFPLTDWITANAAYTGSYNWDRGVSIENDYPFGHTIRNNQVINFQSDFNMTSLYRKIPWLSDVDKELGRQQSRNKKKYKSVKFEKGGYTLEKGTDIIISHNLEAKRVTVRAYTGNKKPVRGRSFPQGNNEVKFSPIDNAEDVRFVITARVEDKDSKFEAVAKRLARVAMSLKSFGFTYNKNSSSVLPGFMKEDLKFGQDGSAPGWGFALGQQDPDFGLNAGDKGWLSTDSSLNSPYLYSSTKQITIKASFEPINSLKIDLNGMWNDSRSNSEYLVQSKGSTSFERNSPMQSGIFSMTYNFIGTAFDKVGTDVNYSSAAYDRFLENTNVAANMLAKQKSVNNSGYDRFNGDPQADGHYKYDLNSSEVLIPSFLAAYRNKEVADVGLSPFPEWYQMMPNWRVTYTGLSRVKLFRKYFRNVTLSHAYRSTYNIGSFASNLSWTNDNDGLLYVINELTNANELTRIIPRYDITTVNMVETFAPLFKIDMKWKNNLTTNVEVRKSRTIGLNITSAQLVETYNDEFVLGLGYRFTKLPIFINSKSVDNDLTIRSDVSVRDNKSIIRRFGDRDNLYSQASTGQKVVTIKFNIDYAISKSVDLRLYYDRIVNNPLVSTSFKTANSNIGASFRFTLTQ